jgi:ferritin-like metal-binding protein YciE
MTVKSPRELFVLMLSELRHGAERSTRIFQEIAKHAQDPDTKEALDARVFVSTKIEATLDEAFKIIGETPLKVNTRLYDVFLDDFSKQLATIQSPDARNLFILARATHLSHLRIGEYVALIATSDVAEHPGVAVLLESCLADKLAFVERTRRLVGERTNQELAAA